MTANISIEILRELLDYNPETGAFKWLVNKGTAKAGDVAGCQNALGYLIIGICGKRYSCHRLAWLCVHGEWPTRQIDHVNTNRSDNRISNLREATKQENMFNRGATVISLTGLKGVSNKGKYGFQARIMVGGKEHYLGLFSTAELAQAAYCAAAHSLHGEFARTA